MKVTVTGIMSLFGRIIHAAMYSAAQSYGIALVVITILMILLIGNLKLGFISMIPNLCPIITVLGFMGWAHIQLDMFTMLIASIATLVPNGAITSPTLAPKDCGGSPVYLG